MEVDGDLTPIFGAKLIQLDGTRLSQIRNEELLNAIDQLCALSASFNHSAQPITSVDKLIANPDQKLYFYWDFDSSRNKSKLLGFVKVGRKSLYLYDKNQAAYEGEFVCILDVYVHQAHQRKGIGHRLIDSIFQLENIRPELLAVDSPSVAFLGFLAKVYGLEKPVWQNTNYVVFQQLFDLSKDGDNKAPEGWRRETIPKRLGSSLDNDPRLRYLVEAIPGHAFKKQDSFDNQSERNSDTLTTRNIQTRQRKQQLLSNKPLW